MNDQELIPYDIIMNSNVQYSHQDAVRPHSSSGDGEYTFWAAYQDHPDKNEYGSVEDHAKTIELSHPVPDIEDLYQTRHLIGHQHERNRDDWMDSRYSNDGSVLFDLTTLGVFDQVVEVENIDPSTLDIPERRLKAIFLQVVHEDLSNFQKRRNQSDCRFLQDNLPDSQDLKNRLAKPEYSPVLAELGYKNPSDLPSYDTFRREIKYRLPIAITDKLPDEVIDELSNENKKKLVDKLELGTEALENAAIRAVHSVFRNGIEPPEQVRDAYGFDDCRPSKLENPDDHPLFVDGRSTRTTSHPNPRKGDNPMYMERFVPRPVKKDALQNCIRLLANQTLTPLTFHRTNSQFDILSFLGAAAASAYSGAGFQTVPDLVDWNHDRDQIPEGSAFPKYVKNRLPRDQMEVSSYDVPSINSQFDEVHRKTLTLAQDYGFFSDSGPFPLATDMYRIGWTGSDSDVTINRPPKPDSDKIQSQFTFNTVGIIDKEARFTFGVRLLFDKSNYPESINQIFSNGSDFVDVKAIYADAENVSGNLINVLRAIAESDHIVKAPRRKEVKTLIKYTPTNCIGYCPAYPWNCHPKPKLIAYPRRGTDPSLVRFTHNHLELIRNETKKKKSQSDLQTLGKLTYQHALNKAQSQTTPKDDTAESQIPLIFEEFDDPASQPGVGRMKIDGKYTHNVYLTGRTPIERSSAGIHFTYYQRWAIEEAINQIVNDFLPVIETDNSKLRLYAVNIAILFQNWHTFINRVVSPKLGLRQVVTHQEMLEAIQHVAFNASE